MGLVGTGTRAGEVKGSLGQSKINTNGLKIDTKWPQRGDKLQRKYEKWPKKRDITCLEITHLIFSPFESL